MGTVAAQHGSALHQGEQRRWLRLACRKPFRGAYRSGPTAVRRSHAREQVAATELRGHHQDQTGTHRIELVWHAFADMEGGEIYVRKIPSMKITDLACAVAPEAKQEIVGIRPGEKLHEQMISEEDSFYTYEYPDYFKILPAINNWDLSALRIKNGKKVQEGFKYTSDSNTEWMSIDTLRKWIQANYHKIGNI